MKRKGRCFVGSFRSPAGVRIALVAATLAIYVEGAARWTNAMPTVAGRVAAKA